MYIYMYIYIYIYIYLCMYTPFDGKYGFDCARRHCSTLLRTLNPEP